MRIFILTGGRAAGKTSRAGYLADEAKKAGLRAAGILSPALENAAGERLGYRAEDVESGESRILALPRDDGKPGWMFDPETFNWGNALVKASPPADLLIADEIGPEELVRNGGWKILLDRLGGAVDRAALLTLRPSLLDAALSRWPGSRIFRVDANISMDLNELFE